MIFKLSRLSFALELKKEDLIKNLYDTNQLKSLIKREMNPLEAHVK